MLKLWSFKSLLLWYNIPRSPSPGYLSKETVYFGSIFDAVEKYGQHFTCSTLNSTWKWTTHNDMLVYSSLLSRQMLQPIISVSVQALDIYHRPESRSQEVTRVCKLPSWSHVATGVLINSVVNFHFAINFEIFFWWPAH